MREWILIDKNGNVVNMALTTRADGPMTPAPLNCHWLPIELVPQDKL